MHISVILPENVRFLILYVASYRKRGIKPMNTEYLRYILAINEYKSINKAAKMLYITQPTLSRILQNIEQDIGITIFNRNRQGVELTNEGAIFIRRIKNMLFELDQLENDYFKNGKHFEDVSYLSIASDRSSPPMDAFIRYYGKYCNRRNHLKLTYEEKNSLDIIDDISNKRLHLGILHYISSKENEILQICKEKGLRCVLIYEGILCAQMKTTHPLAEKETVTIEDLKPYTNISVSDDRLSGLNICSGIPNYNSNEQNKIMVTNSRGVLRTFLLNSDGYYLGNNAQCQLMELQNSISIPVSDFPYTIKTVCIYVENRELSEDEKIYLNILKNIYKSKR